MTDSFRVGLLGHGTVGGAFDTLLSERADAIAAATGRRPELAGVLTRSNGSFDDILESSDDLLHWTPIRTNPAPFMLTDPPGENAFRRFYRTVESR